MEPEKHPISSLDSPRTPEVILDALRDHLEWTEAQRDEALETLIALWPAARLIEAVRPRLCDLSGGDAEAVLRVIESNGSPDVFANLAEALVDQPDLPLDRAWDALAVLEVRGILEEYEELAERWNDLNETLAEGDHSLEELAEQLERDPEEAWIALQGLATIEPEVRASIVQGLADLPLRPGLIEFLRVLAFATDPATRNAALAALDRPEAERQDSHLIAAWSAIARDHPLHEVVEMARLRAGTGTELAVVGSSSIARNAPVLSRSLVTALDGQGRGSVVLTSRAGATMTTAAFLCDVQRGVLEVFGQVDRDGFRAGAIFEEIAPQGEIDYLEDAHELALALLAGSLLLSGPDAPPALQFWLEGTVGPGFRAPRFPAPFPGWDPASLPFSEMPERVESILSNCPSWVDASPLTLTLAEELLLRNGDATPDPRRDAGAYRYLFEHRLLGQLELYRRSLLGMASFWQASGDLELGHSALALAWQLSDAQHAVPSHPFHVALTTRSLANAQAILRSGGNPGRRASL